MNLVKKTRNMLQSLNITIDKKRIVLDKEQKDGYVELADS